VIADDRRTIATIVGRVEVDGVADIPLVARPALVRALGRACLVVGLAGVLCAGLVRLDDRAPRALALDASAAPITVTDHGLGAAPAVLAHVVTRPADPQRPAEPLADAVTSPTTAATDARSAAATAATPTTTTTAAAAATRPGETVESIIADVFGARSKPATAVASCESGLRPAAVSRGKGNWGLFQINKVHQDLVAQMGYSWDDLLDARVNTLVAKEIYDRAGDWSPWGCGWAAS
jgi:hypothetical protein